MIFARVPGVDGGDAVRAGFEATVTVAEARRFADHATALANDVPRGES